MIISFYGKINTTTGYMDTRYVCEVVVEEYINTGGTYYHGAVCPEDYHGEQHLEFYIDSATADDEYGQEFIPLSQDEISELYHMYYTTLYDKVWNKCVNAI